MGGHPDLRHQRPGRARSTSPRSRPTAARTPTRWPRARTASDLYVYVSSYSPNAAFPDCQPPHDKIPSSRCRVDAPGGRRAGRHPGAVPGRRQPGRATARRTTSGCHDITAYPSKDIAAGACMGDGILMDISDRENPKVTEQVRDTDELRVLALGDVQQRRHQGRLHRRARRRRRGRPATRRSGPTRAPTGSTTSSTASSQFKSYFKIPRTRPTPRTAWPTTAR